MKKRIVVLLGMALLLQNCSDDEITNVYSEERNVDERDLLFEDFDDSFVKDNLKVDWERYVSKKTDTGSEIREYRTWSSTEQTLSFGSKEISHKYSVIGSREKGAKIWDYSILKFTGEDKNDLKKVSFFASQGYTGALYAYNIQGMIVSVEVFDSGKLMATFKDIKKGMISKTSKEPDVACEGPACNGGSNGGGRMIVVPVTTYTDWFNVRSDGKLDYNGSTPGRTRTEWVWVSNSVSGSAFNYHRHVTGGRASTSANVHPVEIILDKSFQGTKAECVYKKLAEKNGNLFKKTIGKFIGDPKYDLTFRVGNCSNTNDACTNTDDVENMIVTIEDSRTNSLQLAQYILHEAIHAELYRYVSRYKSGEDPNNRRRLFQLYHYYKNKQKPGSIQHIYMTEKYVNPIASALRQLDNNRYPVDYYKAFAWDGLRVWDANGLLSMKENSQYEKYRNIVIKNSKISCK